VTALLAKPTCRLLTIVGPGGIGKTRLALEVATHRQQYYADGVVFVPLQALATPALLASAIADAVGCPPAGSSSPHRELVRFLQGKAMLLVLDHFEQLLTAEPYAQPNRPALAYATEAVELLCALLQQTTGVHLLVTSREVLNVQEEWLYPLGGLETPPATARSANAEPATAFGAVQLFVERVQHIRREFDFAAEADGVWRLCQLVEGLPLALANFGIRLCRYDQRGLLLLQELGDNCDRVAGRRRRLSLRVCPEASNALLFIGQRL
jgi:predicted ATPase